MKSLKLVTGLAVLVLGFQNCTQARFSFDNSTLDQKSLGGEDGINEPGDDGNIPGGQPGDDGNVPKRVPGDDGARQQICDERYAAVIGSHVPKSLCAEATTVKFMAGQHYYVGDVSFAAKNGNLQVQISLIGNVQMKESHLDIANSPSELEVSPGQFKYNKSYNPLASQYTYSIPLSEANLVVGQTIYARVHAAVVPGKDSILCSEETAWAQGIRSGIGWSMHVPVKITECAN